MYRYLLAWRDDEAHMARFRRNAKNSVHSELLEAFFFHQAQTMAGEREGLVFVDVGHAMTRPRADRGQTRFVDDEDAIRGGRSSSSSRRG